MHAHVHPNYDKLTKLLRERETQKESEGLSEFSERQCESDMNRCMCVCAFVRARVCKESAWHTCTRGTVY